MSTSSVSSTIPAGDFVPMSVVEAEIDERVGPVSPGNAREWFDAHEAVMLELGLMEHTHYDEDCQDYAYRARPLTTADFDRAIDVMLAIAAIPSLQGGPGGRLGFEAIIKFEDGLYGGYWDLECGLWDDWAVCVGMPEANASREDCKALILKGLEAARHEILWDRRHDRPAELDESDHLRLLALSVEG